MILVDRFTLQLNNMSETKLIENYLNKQFPTVDKFLSNLDLVISDLKNATDNANLEVRIKFVFASMCCLIRANSLY